MTNLQHGEAQNWPVYTLFGVNVASDFTFANYIMRADGPADVYFTCVTTPPRVIWQEEKPLFASSITIDTGESFLYIYRVGDCDVLHFTGVADFYLWSNQLLCQILDPAYQYMVELRLLGPVFSYLLERRGLLTLHAAAAVVAGQAVAFLASNSGGKTSLVATLMQRGHPLLTDDILPLELCREVFVGRPSYPQMRMWPEQAEQFIGGYESLELVHPHLSKRRIPIGQGGFGSFCNTSQPIGRLYLPERHEGVNNVSIEPLSLGEMTLELMRHTFLPDIAREAGFEARHFQVLGKLLRQVPVRRLIYPSGVEHLPKIAHYLEEDLTQVK